MRQWILALSILAYLWPFHALAETLRLAVTTSFNNSGLSDILLPQIKSDTDLDIQMLVVGTGQALKLGRSGDVDAILVHSKQAEVEFVAAGFATHRREIMYNDFVIIGPSVDPAKVSLSKSASEAFGRIKEASSVFVSRGDDSGTHRKERSLWQSSGFKVSEFEPSWYREVGAGMGASLNTASAMNAYLLSDRASWLKFGNKGELQLLFSGDEVLFNQYSYLPINREKHPHVKSKAATMLENWLVSEKGQRAIGSYRLQNETLFTPNARAR